MPKSLKLITAVLVVTSLIVITDFECGCTVVRVYICIVVSSTV